VTAGVPAAGRPLVILLAEDSDADAKIALRAFNAASRPSVIHAVRDGQEALDYLYGRGMYSDRTEYAKPDLLLLDLNMPRVDGFAVIDALKKDPAMREVPIVIMTTSRNAGDVLRAYQAGAASYIPKPADYAEFVSSVDRFCAYWNDVSLLPGRVE
jgi:CheY-like chemotaxis protein